MDKFDSAAISLRAVADRIKRPLTKIDASALELKLEKVAVAFNEAFGAVDQILAHHLEELKECVGRLKGMDDDAVKEIATEISFHLENIEPASIKLPRSDRSVASSEKRALPEPLP